jgi:hypothetical protein
MRFMWLTRPGRWTFPRLVAVYDVAVFLLIAVMPYGFRSVSVGASIVFTPAGIAVAIDRWARGGYRCDDGFGVRDEH